MINVRERWLVAGALCLILWPALSCTQDARWKKNMSLGERALEEARYDEAEKIFLACVSDAENFGESDERLPLSLNNLAWLYRLQGKYAEAEPLYQRALGIYETALGPEHPYVATGLNKLALLYPTPGKYAEAEPLYQRSLAIREKALGPEHPDVAQSLNNLALLYKAQGKHAEAEPLDQRALGIYEKALGPEHPDVATSLNNLAGLYHAQGKHAEAKDMEERAKAIRAKRDPGRQ